MVAAVSICWYWNYPVPFLDLTYEISPSMLNFPFIFFITLPPLWFGVVLITVCDTSFMMFSFWYPGWPPEGAYPDTYPHFKTLESYILLWWLSLAHYYGSPASNFSSFMVSSSQIIWGGYTLSWLEGVFHPYRPILMAILFHYFWQLIHYRSFIWMAMAMKFVSIYVILGWIKSSPTDSINIPPILTMSLPDPQFSPVAISCYSYWPQSLTSPP